MEYLIDLNSNLERKRPQTEDSMGWCPKGSFAGNTMVLIVMCLGFDDAKPGIRWLALVNVRSDG